MTKESDFNIRKLELKDRAAIRQISYDTALMGESAKLFFDGQEIISDALTLYFTDYEPESCFVAVVNAAVVGFILGAKSKIVSEKTLKHKIGPDLLWKSIKSGTWLKKKNIIFMASCLGEIIKGGFHEPSFNQEYPATLHINVKEGFRGLDLGSKLMDIYLSYLKAEKIPGVHLATMSDRGANFFSQQGFALLYIGKRSYFRHILHKDVPLYIYGKKL